MKSPIYLDSAATTPILPELVEQMSDWLRRFGANPSSQHRAGRVSLAALEDAKDRIKQACLGDNPSLYGGLDAWRVIITSGGTEANNQALLGLGSPHAPLLLSPVEHPSLLVPATFLSHVTPRLHSIDIDPLTLSPNIDVLEQLLSEHANSSSVPCLVSVMLGNNETGLVHDLRGVSQVCRRYGAILHSDCVQAIGKVPATDYVPHVDAITVSAHKLHGPVGVGALLVRSNISIRPLMHGGAQQLELRPGTESVVLTLALATVLEEANRFRLAGGSEQLRRLRDHFESALLANSPAISIGASHLRLPHISSLAFPGWDRQALLMALDLAGIQCSTGSACASGSSQPSYVLTALRLPDPWIASALRFSVHRMHTVDEMTEAAGRVARIVNR